MKTRLKKIALMSPDMFQGQLDQISDQGRNILKSIEEYKFFVEQASRVVKNDPKLTEVIINKKKNLDQAAQQIYDVVFQIENVDVISLYNEQQEAVNENNESLDTEKSEKQDDPKEEVKDDSKDEDKKDPEDSKDTSKEDKKEELQDTDKKEEK